MKNRLLMAALASAVWIPLFPVVQAQQLPPSADFVFAGDPLTPAGTIQPCSGITAWNGDTQAYAQDMGSICLHQGDLYGGSGSYLDVPWQLGFLNNGYLAGCNALTWDARIFSIGDGTHPGDAFTQAGSTTCPYYTGEYGGDSDNILVSWSVVASYTVVQRRSCSRYRCTTYLTNVLLGGTGTVQESLLEARGTKGQILADQQGPAANCETYWIMYDLHMIELGDVPARCTESD